MKRIKSLNGYTIYMGTARDEKRGDAREGMFYVYFSSDIRDFGREMSYAEYDDIDTIEEAEALCMGNYAHAREIAEEYSTAASFEEIERIETMLDNGMSADDVHNAIEEEAEAEEEAEEARAEAERIEAAHKCMQAQRKYEAAHGFSAARVMVYNLNTKEMMIADTRGIYGALRNMRRMLGDTGEGWVSDNEKGRRVIAAAFGEV